MNKSLLKFLTDFGPLLIFFAFYYKSGNNLRIAIPPLIIATLIAVIVVYFIEKKIPYIPLIGAVLISIFGGLTLYFDNPVFIYMKPTVINIVFSGFVRFYNLHWSILTIVSLITIGIIFYLIYKAPQQSRETNSIRIVAAKDAVNNPPENYGDVNVR